MLFRSLLAGGDRWINVDRIPTSGDSMGLPPGGLGEVGDPPINPFAIAPLRYIDLPWESEDVPGGGEGSSSHELEESPSPLSSAGSLGPPAVEGGLRRAAAEAEGRVPPPTAVETQESPAAEEGRRNVATEAEGQDPPSTAAGTQEPPAAEESRRSVATEAEGQDPQLTLFNALISFSTLFFQKIARYFFSFLSVFFSRQGRWKKDRKSYTFGYLVGKRF